MSLLVLSYDQVKELLPMEECIGVMEQALASLARGEVHQPLRTAMAPGGGNGLLALMPAYQAAPAPAYGLKAVCVFEKNPERGLDSHQGGVLLFSGETGELRAVMNASAITAIRTAAVSAVATKLLARDDAMELAIIGTGVQARAHLEAMACVRPVLRARIVGLRAASAEKFAAEARERFRFPVLPVETVKQAAHGADLIVTATNSREPILQSDWVAPGAHLNVVGSSVATDREVDSKLMARASLFVDRRESTLNEAGDYLLAARDGMIGPDHIRAELGEILIGTSPGRTAPDEVTLFKSLGLAAEDLACADYLCRRAQETNIGSWVDY